MKITERDSKAHVSTSYLGLKAGLPTATGVRQSVRMFLEPQQSEVYPRFPCCSGLPAAELQEVLHYLSFYRLVALRSVRERTVSFFRAACSPGARRRVWNPPHVYIKEGGQGGEGK